MKNYLLIFSIPLLLSSCVKDKPNITNSAAAQLSNSKKVFIVNEGNFMSGNSSVSLYDPGSSQVIEKFYQSQNNTSQLGDVAQSMTHYNSEYFLVVNNSSKIVVTDDQLKAKATISGFTSPRYILPVSNSKGYVSDLYSNKLFVVNLNTNTISSFIPCPGWTEKMVLSYSKAFVTNIKRNYLYVINTSNDAKTDSIDVGPGAGDIVVDKNDKLWVLCAGNSTAAIAPTLKRIDPLTNQIEATLNFNLNDTPNNLCFNRTKDTLYFLNGGIFRMPVNESSVPTSAFIAKGNRTYYGLGINTADFTIYASDALDYIQRSVIYIFDSNGNDKSHFNAGINSNSFYFE